MSFTDVRPYFRARIETAAPKLKEWTDGFNQENIPATLIQRGCFHIAVGRFQLVKRNQNGCFEFAGVATLNLYADGTKDPQKCIDEIIATGQAIAIESLKAKNRATQPSIKNVDLGNFDPSALSISNDNKIRLTMDFNLTIYLDIEERP
jgi:hypothetical protein